MQCCFLPYSLPFQESCNINARNRLLRTPLHLTILKGHSRVVERLVCRGADLTAIDQDGNTPLHLLLAGHGMEQLCADTPLLNRVRVPYTF